MTILHDTIYVATNPGIAGALSSWVPIAAVILALVTLIIQNNTARNTAQLNALLNLWTQFDSPALRAMRVKAARGLLAGDPAASEGVLDYLEGIGLLTHKKAVDPDMVWHSFAAWVFLYWESAEDYIKKIRQTEDTTWCELEYIYNKMLDIQIERSKVRRTVRPFLDPSRRKEFLEAEAGLS